MVAFDDICVGPFCGGRRLHLAETTTPDVGRQCHLLGGGSSQTHPCRLCEEPQWRVHAKSREAGLAISMNSAVTQGRRTGWSPVTLVAVDVLVAAGAPLLDRYMVHHDLILGAGAAVIASSTFLGVWLIQRKEAAGRAVRNSMRDAIAAAFVMTYLVIVSWSAFFNFLLAQGPATLSPLSATLVTNFTVLTGIVVGGYFGADAVKQVTQINAMRGPPVERSPNSNDTVA
jgi:hypothetical protein